MAQNWVLDFLLRNSSHLLFKSNEDTEKYVGGAKILEQIREKNGIPYGDPDFNTKLRKAISSAIDEVAGLDSMKERVKEGKL